MEAKTLKLLMIEDNPIDVEIVRTMLRQYGRVNFALESLHSTEEALTRLLSEHFDLVLLDYNLPGEDGLTFLHRLERTGNMPPVIMLTGDGDERLAADAVRSGAYDYFPKRSINSTVLARAIHQALEKHELDTQLRTRSTSSLPWRRPSRRKTRSRRSICRGWRTTRTCWARHWG
jgi:DNA-binding NtrC family response regulator